MKRREHGQLLRRQKWQDHIEHRREIGQSVRRYCQEHGLSKSMFYSWQRRFAMERKNGSPSIVEKTPSSFATIAVRPPLQSSSERIQIHLASGLRVELPLSIDPAWASRLIALVVGGIC